MQNMTKIAGTALLFLAAVCLLSTPGIAELKSNKITDLAGQSFVYWHGVDFVDQFDSNVFFPKYGENGFVERMDLKLYPEPIVSVLWIVEMEKQVKIDVVAEMYDRINTSGGNATKAVLGTVEIGGAEWRTAAAPKKDGKGFNHVAIIAYTNGKKTAMLIMDEIRPELDLDGFNKTLEYVQFEKDSGTQGLPLAYY
jgi:hypothetical protein